MEIMLLCSVVATLGVLPNRSQFFQYEPVSLSCGQQQGNSSEWRIKRNTSSKVNQECSSFWDGINDSSCSTDDLYPSDTGVYWCESAAGGCSDAVSIMVTAGSVILEGPVSPVMEGDSVTLRCRTQLTSSSNPTTDFYKDGLLLRRSSTGNLTILSVSKSDEGIYKCNISGAGESLDSRLTVRGCLRPPSSILTHIQFPVVVVCLSLLSLLLLLSVMLLYLWKSHKGKVNCDVSYTDVVITQEEQPSRSRDEDAATTFYSTLNLANT